MPSKNHYDSIPRLLAFTLMGCSLLTAPTWGAETNAPSGTDVAKKLVDAPKRDPFWPVGYVPESIKAAADANTPKVAPPAASNDWSAAMKKVVINGVSSRNDEYFAVINGRIMSVNDSVTVQHDGMIYTWAVENIKPPGSVKLRRVSAR